MKIYCSNKYGDRFPDPANLNFYGSYRIKFNVFDCIFRRGWVKANPFISATGKVYRTTCEEAVEKYVANLLQQKRTPTNYVSLEVFPDGTYLVKEEVNHDEVEGDRTNS